MDSRLVFLLVLSLTIGLVTSLKCYKHDKTDERKPKSDPEECEKMCVLKEYKPKSSGDTMYERSCSSEEKTSGCSTEDVDSNNKQESVTTCYCNDKDNCNHAGRITATAVTLAIIPTVLNILAF